MSVEAVNTSREVSHVSVTGSSVLIHYHSFNVSVCFVVEVEPYNLINVPNICLHDIGLPVQSS